MGTGVKWTLESEWVWLRVTPEGLVKPPQGKWEDHHYILSRPFETREAAISALMDLVDLNEIRGEGFLLVEQFRSVPVFD